MKPLLPLLILLPLAGCGQEPAPPPPKSDEPRNVAAPAPSPTPPKESAAEPAESADAAAVLKRYYALIASGDYEAAARLRSGGAVDAERLADNFRAYASYSAQVGTPRRPVEAKGWLYVEVPVMITGRFKGGKSFGSAGSVTMRRAAPSAEAPPGGRQWRVFTG